MANNKNGYYFNPLVDDNPMDTLANVQSMLARIQTFTIKNIGNNAELDQCPAAKLYTRLLIIIHEAILYEIERFNHSPKQQ